MRLTGYFKLRYSEIFCLWDSNFWQEWKLFGPIKIKNYVLKDRVLRQKDMKIMSEILFVKHIQA
jgi:hypothetical protein